MKQDLRIILGEAKGLIDAEKLDLAIRQLDKIGEEDRKRLSKQELSELLYMYARCYRLMSRYQLALERITEAIKLLKVNRDDSLLAREKQLLGQLYQQLGQLRKAVETYREVRTLRMIIGETDLIHRSLVNIALVQLIQGELREAWQSVGDAVDRCREFVKKRAQTSGEADATRKAQSEEKVCQFSKARIGLYLGKFGESEAILNSYSDGELTGRETAEMLQLRGMLSVFRREYTDARESLDEALSMYQDLVMPRDQVVCREFLGLNEYFKGDYSEASNYYGGIDVDGVDITHSARVQLLRLRTDVLIAQNRLAEAWEVASRVEAEAERLGETIEVGAIHRAMGRIHALTGDGERAEREFDESIETLIRASANFELALAYLEYGRSEVFGRELRRQRLGKALELYSIMGTSEWVKEVEVEMTSLEEEDSVEKEVPDLDLKMTWEEVEELEKELGV